MSELRRDPIGGRWVIVDTDHPNKPEEFEYEPYSIKGGTCPFCLGNESMTPPEVDAIRDTNTKPDTPGWRVRLVPNKYPALDKDAILERQGVGIYDKSSGVGAHEVLVESPSHEKDIVDLSYKEVEDFISVSQRRSRVLSEDKRFEYIMIFKNFGASAGASLEHPHLQIVALPMVPKSAKEELKGAKDYFDFRERCIYCDIIRQEHLDKVRIILENEYFLSFCPFVSRFSFEIGIVPKKHNSSFSAMPQEEIPALASILKDTITKLEKVFTNVPYNFIIHSSPLNAELEKDYYHWHIEFMPKLIRIAGFEWGTGFYTVLTPPEIAAKYLRES